MAKPKYSLETRLAVANHYIAGHDCARRTAERFGVEETSVRRWISAWQLHGIHRSRPSIFRWTRLLPDRTIFSRCPSRGVYGEEGLLNNIYYYNNERISQKLKGLRPVEYRSQALKAA